MLFINSDEFKDHKRQFDLAVERYYNEDNMLEGLMLISYRLMKSIRNYVHSGRYSRSEYTTVTLPLLNKAINNAIDSLSKPGLMLAITANNLEILSRTAFVTLKKMKKIDNYSEDAATTALEMIKKHNAEQTKSFMSIGNLNLTLSKWKYNPACKTPEYCGMTILGSISKCKSCNSLTEY